MAMALLFLLLRELPAESPRPGNLYTGGRLAVGVDLVTGVFNISVGAELWLNGWPPLMAGCGSSPAPPLKLSKHTTARGSHSTLGPYSEVRFFWTAEAAAVAVVQTAIRIFADGETAMFDQHWPAGLPPCGANVARSGELLSFPLFGPGVLLCCPKQGRSLNNTSSILTRVLVLLAKYTYYGDCEQLLF